MCHMSCIEYLAVGCKHKVITVTRCALSPRPSLPCHPTLLSEEDITLEPNECDICQIRHFNHIRVRNGLKMIENDIVARELSRRGENLGTVSEEVVELMYRMREAAIGTRRREMERRVAIMGDITSTPTAPVANAGLLGSADGNGEQDEEEVDEEDDGEWRSLSDDDDYEGEEEEGQDNFIRVDRNENVAEVEHNEDVSTTSVQDEMAQVATRAKALLESRQLFQERSMSNYDYQGDATSSRQQETIQVGESNVNVSVAEVGESSEDDEGMQDPSGISPNPANMALDYMNMGQDDDEIQRELEEEERYARMTGQSRRLIAIRESAELVLSTPENTSYRNQNLDPREQDPTWKGKGNVSSESNSPKTSKGKKKVRFEEPSHTEASQAELKYEPHPASLALTNAILDQDVVELQDYAGPSNWKEKEAETSNDDSEDEGVAAPSTFNPINTMMLGGDGMTHSIPIRPTLSRKRPSDDTTGTEPEGSTGQAREESLEKTTSPKRTRWNAEERPGSEGMRGQCGAVRERRRSFNHGVAGGTAVLPKNFAPDFPAGARPRANSVPAPDGVKAFLDQLQDRAESRQPLFPRRERKQAEASNPESSQPASQRNRKLLPNAPKSSSPLRLHSAVLPESPEAEEQVEQEEEIPQSPEVGEQEMESLEAEEQWMKSPHSPEPMMPNDAIVAANRVRFIRQEMKENMREQMQETMQEINTADLVRTEMELIQRAREATFERHWAERRENARVERETRLRRREQAVIEGSAHYGPTAEQYVASLSENRKNNPDWQPARILLPNPNPDPDTSMAESGEEEEQES